MSPIEGPLLGRGPIAAALAKAQASFGPVKRDKKVRVQTKSGGSYEFAYAPLDSILEAVRKPLADNGLVVVQVLDHGSLVTMLLHDSGAELVGTWPLPATGDIQGMGSAVTYLRRYAIQALLGIAAEEDDDGNRGDGNDAEDITSGGEKLELLGSVKIAGRIARGGSERYKAEWRETPEGWAIGFRIERGGEGKDAPQVLVTGALGSALYIATNMDGSTLVGQRVTVGGRLYSVKVPGRTVYNRLVAGEIDDAARHFVETSEFRIPPLPDPEQALVDAAEAVTAPLFDSADMAEVDAAATES